MGPDLNPSRRRVGILGGSFDPIHFGHLRLAESMREALALDTVLFVPAQVSPFKTGRTTTPAALRAKMVGAAIDDNPLFQIWTGELERPGPSFTVDTLRQLTDELPDDQLWLLAGTDAVRDLPLWREPETIVRLARLAVAARPGTDPVDALAALPETWRERVDFVTMTPVDLASTDLRQRVASGRSIRYLVPPSVAEIIDVNDLYKQPEIPL
jgi:nicotinate-nucleotide adenylyltransferase